MCKAKTHFRLHLGNGNIIVEAAERVCTDQGDMEIKETMENETVFLSWPRL